MATMLALYRKYRPSDFGEVIGQEAILQVLKNALKRSRISHAYLFTGPRGSGKTTIARLLAKAVNCLNPKDGLPCSKCAACLSFAGNQVIDLTEIDAASNRGIDEIRDLREGVKFTPLQSKYKVFIIDEVHMLTKEAFNALLKTLEEPPSHAIFILATTEIEKVPLTIISRCQRFDFKKVPADQIQELLKKVCKSEKIEIDSESLRLVAASAEGSVRDALSLMDQVLVSAGSGRILADVVEKIIGRMNVDLIVEFIQTLLQKDAKAGISFLNNLLDEGHDLNSFSRMCVNYIRRMLVLKINPDLISRIAFDFTPEQQEKLKQLSGGFQLSELQKLANIFVSAENKVQYASVQILALELAVVEYVS